MDAVLVGNLERIVSASRLQRYRQAATSDLETAVLYCWNIQLAEALLPSMALLEITLRNSVHNTLTAHTGSEFWFKQVLNGESYNNILGVISTITRNQGYPPTVGKVISEITFGFWPKMFAKSYQPLWWDVNNPLLPSVLPNFSKIGRDTRKHLEERLEYFAKLRNRAMHHEAVFQGVAPLNRPVVMVDILHEQLIETIGWIDTEADILISCLNRFDSVYRHGKSNIETELRQKFNI